MTTASVSDLGEVGIVSVSLDVDPGVAERVQPDDEVTFRLGSWQFTGRVISVAHHNVLIDTDGHPVRLVAP